LRVHPDKHPDDNRATKLFQDLDPFFQKCVKRLLPGQDSRKTKKARKMGTTSSLPLEFDVRDKWPFLDLKLAKCEAKYIPKQVAFQCMNTRGAIAHGRNTPCKFNVTVKNEPNGVRSVEEIFIANGGSKHLEEIDDIKTELMAKGPVVSTSFRLTQPFMNKIENSHLFDEKCIGETYPLLIFGWKLTAFGEVWLVQPLGCDQSVVAQKIAFGQFGIDDDCCTPVNSFEKTPWEPGPYFDLQLSSAPAEWRTKWKSMDISISSKLLENLGEVLGKDILKSSGEKKRFVVRDKTKLAHSRACFLSGIEWKSGMSIHPWRITLEFLG